MRANNKLKMIQYERIVEAGWLTHSKHVQEELGKEDTSLQLPVAQNCGEKLWRKIVAKKWGKIVAQTELSTTVTINNDHHHQQQHHNNFHDKEWKLASWR